MNNRELAGLLREAGDIIFDLSGCSFRDFWEAADELEKAEPVAYWVLFDATADQKYIKKSVHDGCLTFFDNEADARRARDRHANGCDYKRVSYYTHPPAPQGPDGYTAKLEGAIRKIYRRMDSPESFDSVINEICRDALAAAPQPGEA